MLKLSQLVGVPLKWTQPSMMRMEYVLLTGETVAATLVFRSAWGTFATAESADGCWTFKRIGFWQNRASIRRCDSEMDLAIFTNNTWSSGGTLEFIGGRSYKISNNCWMTRYEIRDAVDEPVIQFNYGGFLHTSAEVEILPQAALLSELPPMLIFGFYIALMLHRDSAAAAAAT
ncbi:MAG TPA: hypothetical protein PKG95_08200 [Anaerolineaceae bacterium]|nr:hypothetical protein [Anaerolineaceae bacterium]